MHSIASGLERLAAAADEPVVARLSEAFANAGFTLALVGGPVRDALLGRITKDWDFTTDARPDDITSIIAPFSDALWDVGRDFGTIAARIEDLTVEITTFRADTYDRETRKPHVEFGSRIEDDLLRRDFTVNAMAFVLPAKVLVDPSGGIEDLLEGVLRTPSSPEISFGDDPLRMLRGARFSAQLGFHLDADTQQAMSDMAESLSIISAERISEELAKIMASPSPRRGWELLVECGLADLALPELPALQLEVDEHHHHKDVYEHSLTVLDQVIDLEHARHPGTEPDLILRWAALLHDIGKPATRKLGPGHTVSFLNHDLVGARLVRKRLKALRFDNDSIRDISRLVELHMRFFGYTEGAWTDSAVRRYVRDAGPVLERLHMLTRADVTTRNKRKAERLSFAYDDLEKRIAELAEQEQLDAVRPDLDGEQIMQLLDIPPGPLVGKAYRHLLEVRLDEGPLEHDEAVARLRQWWAEQQ